MTHLGPSLRRTKVRERPWARVVLALLASLALNTLLLLVVARSGAFLSPRGQASRVTLAPVSPERWAANRAIRGEKSPAETPERFAMPRPPPKPPPEPEADKNSKGQVVDIARPAEEKAPKDSRFLSEYDSSVEKETRSRHAKAGHERTLPTPSAPGKETGPRPGEGGRSDVSVPGAEGALSHARPQEAPKRISPAPRDDGGDLAGRPPRIAAAPPRDAPRQDAPSPAEGGKGGLRSRGAPDALKVPPGTLARLSGGPAPDHLAGVEEGEATWLNTRSWKYASYFNRMKDAVARAWDPSTPYAARDPDGSLYGQRDRETVCDVTLDDRGNLKNVDVAESSGLEFLDLAAVKAFETAAPFPNPPRGVVDPNGEIRFPFAFTFHVTRQRGISVQWGPGTWSGMPNPASR